MSFSAKKYAQISKRKSLIAASTQLLVKGLKEDKRIAVLDVDQILMRRKTLVRFKNRCIVSNRGKSIYRQWSVSRIVLRSWATAGLVFGLHKSSW